MHVILSKPKKIDTRKSELEESHGMLQMLKMKVFKDCLSYFECLVSQEFRKKIIVLI